MTLLAAIVLFLAFTFLIWFVFGDGDDEDYAPLGWKEWR